MKPDLVQDIVFGATMIVSGARIIYTAFKARSKAATALLGEAITFLVFALSVYGTFYL
jgi:uncharacterized membrane protein HdeD (DUF308 family)